MSDLCACGEPLHYTDEQRRVEVERLVASFGALIKVTVLGETFMVPRHYIALHGLAARDLSYLADLYDWKRA